jgi:hypothetical protein
MEWVWQGIAREWLAVTGAPFLYGVALIFVTTTVATMIWFLLNLYYRSILASKDAEVALLLRQRDDYKDKLESASPEQVKALKPHVPADWDMPLTKTFRQTFRNQTVDLDGRHFIECSFENVTLRYQGTRPFMNSIPVSGSTRTSLVFSSHGPSRRAPL